MNRPTDEPPGQVLAGLGDERVLAIVRCETAIDAINAALVLRDEGLRYVEVSLTTPGALTVIAEFAPDDRLAVGAGTVLTAAQAYAAAEAGARYLVTPAVSIPVLTEAAASDLPVLCGAYTASEAVTAVGHGAAAVKLFPASHGGPGYLRALRAPLPDVRFVPVGGVAIDDVPDWLAAGAYAVGIGSPLIGDAAAGGDLRALAARTRRLLAALG